MNGSLTLRCATVFVAVCSLLFCAGTAQAQAVLDQWYDSSCLPNNTFSVNTGIEDAQTFVPCVSGPLTRVDVYVSAFAPTSGNMMLDIRDTLAGLPNNTLGTASVAAAMLPPITTAPGWVTFVFAPAPNVVAGKQYAIVAYGDPTFSSGTWYATAGNNYPSGTGYRRGTLPPPPTAWLSFGVSFGFRTFVGNAPYPALPAPCTLMPACGSGGGGSGSGGGGSAPAVPPGEGSFAGDPAAAPPPSGEGAFGFGAHLAASSLQASASRPPVLSGPYTASLVPAPFGAAAAPPAGTSLQVFNVSFQAQASGSTAAASDAPTVLPWLVFAGLTAAAVLALAWAIQGLASSAPPDHT